MNQGTSFGFRIRSEMQFLCLRGGQGFDLEVVTLGDRTPAGPLELAVEWTAQPGQGGHGRLYRRDREYWLWTGRGRWTLIEPDVPRITLPSASSEFTA